MSMINLVILAIVAVILIAVIAYLVRKTKSGAKCIGCPDSGSCGGNCSGCSCHQK